MLEFIEGEKVFITSGDYKGESAIVINYQRDTYLCRITGRYEEVIVDRDELESAFDHDMRMLQAWKQED